MPVDYRIMQCGFCKEKMSIAGELFCSQDCRNKWKATIRESEYAYGD